MMRSRMREFGLRTARRDELGMALRLGEQLIDDSLAAEDVVARVHDITGVTAWVAGAPINGIFLIIPLSVVGEQAVRNSKFTPGDPSRRHLAGVGEPCGGVYVGVYAGASKPVRRNIMLASATLRTEIFGPVPCFARAATDDGARSMASLGFKPAGFGARDLFVQEAISKLTRTA